jgi:hypothetical protein
MTASIMMAVPARRAGAGSAMNDATRELGAALGIAILGSVAASHYATKIAPFLRHLTPSEASTARTSIAGAARVAQTLPARAGRVLEHAANVAFVDGVHVAVSVGAVLATISAIIVYRYLPHSLVASGAMTGPLGSLEEAAELGLGGVPPVFADAHADGDAASDPVSI